jgi:DNA-binding transcriptional ArsR family regulator
MDDVFKALADPTRRAIIDELAARNDQTLFELCSRLIANWNLGASRQAISKHITVLVDAGLVEAHRLGRTTVHHFHPGPLGDAARWVTSRSDTDISDTDN